MKRALLSIFAAAFLVILNACGGGSGSGTSTTSPTSGIKKRVFVTDRFQGVVYIVDAAADLYRGHTIRGGSAASLMVVMADKKNTVLVDPVSNALVAIDNASESTTGSVGLPGATESIAASPDNKTVYAAIRNAPVTGQLPGLVEVFDITATTGTTPAQIPVPTVHRIVLSHNGSKLLTFSDNSNQVGILDTASKAVTYVGGFDHPVFGVFSSDDSTAYILSCGAECGGTTAKVNTLAISTGTVGPDVIVSGATTALLDSSNLYVAGNNAGSGKLDIINTSNMSVTKSGVAITNGYHSIMSLGPNNRLFIGSTGCSNTAMGCLSIYNTSSSSVINSAAGTGDVTGIQPITGRTVVYVCEGGELVIWDTATDAPIPAAKQIDIVGQAYDVKLID